MLIIIPVTLLGLHSDVSYPGTLGPGTARISDLPVSQDNSSTMYHIIFEEVFLAHIAHVQVKKNNPWIKMCGLHRLAVTK